LEPGVRYVVRSTLKVNGNTVTGPFVTEVLDEFGALLLQYDGLINGNRQGP
jgi:hypothetical protein